MSRKWDEIYAEGDRKDQARLDDIRSKRDEAYRNINEDIRKKADAKAEEGRKEFNAAQDARAKKARAGKKSASARGKSAKQAPDVVAEEGPKPQVEHDTSARAQRLQKIEEEPTKQFSSAGRSVPAGESAKAAPAKKSGKARRAVSAVGRFARGAGRKVRSALGGGKSNASLAKGKSTGGGVKESYKTTYV